MKPESTRSSHRPSNTGAALCIQVSGYAFALRRRGAFMTRWITFDQATADGLRARVPTGSVFEFPGRSLLEYALNCPQNVVGVLDTGIQSRCAVAVFRHRSAQHERVAPA